MVALSNSPEAVGAKGPEPGLPPERNLLNLPSWLLYPVWLPQALKFLLVGILNTALDVALYLALTRWFGFFATRKVVAKAISYAVGIVNSFYWNKSWTFKVEAGPVGFGAFVAASLAAMAINAGVMYLSLKGLNLPEGLALVLATGTAFIWNFTISKCLIFGQVAGNPSGAFHTSRAPRRPSPDGTSRWIKEL